MIEQNLTGVMAMDEGVTSLVFQTLSADMFFDKKCQKAVEYMFICLRDGRPYTIVTVADEIDADISVVQDWVALADLSMVNEYIERVKSNYLNKSFKGALVSAAATLDKEGFESSYQEIDSKARELLEVSKEEEDIYEKALSSVDRAMSGEGFPVVKTGINSYDEKYAGVYFGDLSIIAARPSMGKTALMLNLAANAAKVTGVLIFSLEMSKQAIIYRLASIESGVPAWKIKTGKATKDQAERYKAAIIEISKWNLVICGSAYSDISKILAKIRIEKIKNPDLSLVCIDYIQLIEMNSKENRTAQISTITRALKLIAGEEQCNLGLVALSQLSRQVESRGNKRPMLSDLRDSGSIEQDADTVMFLYRDDYYQAESQRKLVVDSEVEIICKKQREGSPDTIYEKLHLPTGKFKQNELAQIHEECPF